MDYISSMLESVTSTFDLITNLLTEFGGILTVILNFVISMITEFGNLLVFVFELIPAFMGFILVVPKSFPTPLNSIYYFALMWLLFVFSFNLFQRIKFW